MFKIYFERKNATEVVTSEDKVFVKTRLCYNSIIAHRSDILELEIDSSTKLRIKNEEDLQNALRVIDLDNQERNLE